MSAALGGVEDEKGSSRSLVPRRSRHNFINVCGGMLTLLRVNPKPYWSPWTLDTELLHPKNP